MEVYVLSDNSNTFVINDDTQLKKKLTNIFNDFFNYDLEPEQRDSIIENLLKSGYAKGDIFSDFTEYRLTKNTII